MANIMIVDAELLPETPQAFQDYVAQYFVERTILGRRAFVATQYLRLDSWKFHAKGSAPRHSVDLQHFRTGLRPSQSLNAWMIEANGKYLWTFAGGYDSDCVTHVD